MHIDEQLILYALAKSFKNTFSVKLSKTTIQYINDNTKKYNKQSSKNKIYYTKYGMSLAQSLTEYMDDIILFDITAQPDTDTDSDSEIIYEFALKQQNDDVTQISFTHTNIAARNVIPNKLMKICKYKRNTNVSKQYTTKYDKLNKHIYNKYHNLLKYSSIKDSQKSNNIYEPICDLVYNTLSKKRKCASHLYNYLFAESEQIVLKLYKNRFVIYDFTISQDNIQSYRMKRISLNELSIKFNNNLKFNFILKTNAYDIKENISLKFHVRVANVDEVYAVKNGSV